MKLVTEQTIKADLIEQASEDNNQLLLIKAEQISYVKGHCLPEETRADYVSALQELLQDNFVRCLFKNKDLELYECTGIRRVYTIDTAAQMLREELQRSGALYRIHSTDGEYVQCGELAFNAADAERIVFLKALQMLHQNSEARVTVENRHLCRFETTPSTRRESYALTLELPRYEDVTPNKITAA